MAKKKPPVSVNIGVSAKARATAKLTARVPTRSMGRLVDALTDIIRPFTERRGLRADLIRLQREEVAFEIAKRAAERIALKKQPINPVPIKIIVPLLESGSQESPDDDFMIDMWAALLASATTQTGIARRFVSLLSEIDGKQARLLSSFAKSGKRDPLPLDSHTKAQIERRIRAHYETGGSARNVRQIFESYESLTLQSIMSATHEARIPFQPETIDVDLEILSSLGLVELVEARIDTSAQSSMIVNYVGITLLGAALLRVTSPRAEVEA